MADIINLLPDNIANQIAAGEVVQRPASVVKELMENAVDAGSTNIKLIIKNAGKQLIQVTDNGCGMTETDARMCFERHATSKIRALDDLYRIYTLGFRGEALASIAAVAQVELRSKRKEDAAGTGVNIENSEVLKQEPVAMADGTSIAVKNLFYNVPARRNFLKSNSVELRHIHDEFLRVALAHPEIAFTYTNENEDVYQLKEGKLSQRIAGIFGKKYEQILIPVEETSDFISIRGYVGKPDSAKKIRGEQFFFVNDRFIKNAYLNHAIDSAYEKLLPDGSFPFYAIFLSIPPSRIDINVHPTKTEIKFEDEKTIYAILRSTVRKGLSQYNVAPSLNFDEEVSAPIVSPQFAQKSESRLRLNDLPAYRENTGNDTKKQGGQTFKSGPEPQKTKPEEWDELYKALSLAQPDETEKETAEDSLLGNEETYRQPVLQLHRKFVISTIRSGMLIIHQQLAHERILFEKYINVLENSHAASQQLLFPEVVNLQLNDFKLMQEIWGDVKSMGFEMEEFGKNAILINGIPLDIKGQALKEMIEKLINDYKNSQHFRAGDKKERLAAAMAKNAAIKTGQALGAEEMATLIDELFGCGDPYFSPDGKPTMITISTGELDKKFKL